MELLYGFIIIALYSSGVFVAVKAVDVMGRGNAKNDIINFVTFLAAVAFLLGLTYALGYAYRMGAESVALPSPFPQ